MLKGTPKMLNSSSKFNGTAQCRYHTNYLLWSFSSLTKARITTLQLTWSSGKNVGPQESLKQATLKCPGTRRKFREGGGKYWMRWFGGCFWLELHYCSGEVKYGGAVVMMMLVMTMTKMTFTERISSARCCAKTLHVLAHLNFTNNLTR